MSSDRSSSSTERPRTPGCSCSNGESFKVWIWQASPRYWKPKLFSIVIEEVEIFMNAIAEFRGAKESGVQHVVKKWGIICLGFDGVFVFPSMIVTGRTFCILGILRTSSCTRHTLLCCEPLLFFFSIFISFVFRTPFLILFDQALPKSTIFEICGFDFMWSFRKI